jgi:hypothetical protein
MTRDDCGALDREASVPDSTISVWSISWRNTSDWRREPPFPLSALDPPIADASLTSSSSSERRVSDSGKC